jgi:hypothetical protein
MNKVEVRKKPLIIVSGIVLLSIVLMIVTIPGILHDTFPEADPKKAATGTFEAMIFHLLVLFGFLVAIIVNKRGGRVNIGVYNFLGIVLLILGLVYSLGAVGFLAHKTILYVSILMFLSVICDLAAAIITFTALLSKPKEKKSLFARTPSWLLAFLVFIVAAVVFTISDSILTPHTETGLISHIINDLIIAAGCFFIVMQNPKSIWYVPLICNALLILSSILEPNFWKSLMWIPICAGWVLSVIASILGAMKGRKIAISDHP